MYNLQENWDKADKSLLFDWYNEECFDETRACYLDQR